MPADGTLFPAPCVVRYGLAYAHSLPVIVAPPPALPWHYPPCVVLQREPCLPAAHRRCHWQGQPTHGVSPRQRQSGAVYPLAASVQNLRCKAHEAASMKCLSRCYQQAPPSLSPLSVQACLHSWHARYSCRSLCRQRATCRSGNLHELVPASCCPQQSPVRCRQSRER